MSIRIASIGFDTKIQTGRNENRVSITQIRYEHSIWSEWRELECKRSPTGLLIAQIANDSIIRTACSAICGLFVCKPDQRNRKCQMTLPISWSEWRDSNPRPLGPEPSAHTKLSYTPILFRICQYIIWHQWAKVKSKKGICLHFYPLTPCLFLDNTCLM